jgi:hypothetical protein
VGTVRREWSGRAQGQPHNPLARLWCPIERLHQRALLLWKEFFSLCFQEKKHPTYRSFSYPYPISIYLERRASYPALFIHYDVCRACSNCLMCVLIGNTFFFISSGTSFFRRILRSPFTNVTLSITVESPKVQERSKFLCARPR